MAQNCCDRDRLTSRDLTCIQTSKWPRTPWLHTTLTLLEFYSGEIAYLEVLAILKIGGILKFGVVLKLGAILKFEAILEFVAILEFKLQNGPKRKGKYWAILKFECMSSHVTLSLPQQFWAILRCISYLAKIVW